MGRSPCCSKEEGLNRGVWTAMEDKILTDYINVHGGRKWRNLPKKAGLKRCGKSCRLRWLNYLRPDIKRGHITRDEEELIIRLHKLLGNRWSLIAGRLPGRTDNEIKNYWNTTYGKKVQGGQTMTNTTSNHTNLPNLAATGRPVEGVPVPPSGEPCVVVRTKATRWCINNTVLLPPNNEPHINNAAAEIETKPMDEINANQSEPLMLDHGSSSGFSTMMDDLEMDDEFLSNLVIDTDFMELCGFDDGKVHSDDMKTSTSDHGSYSSPNFDHQPFILSEDHNLDLQSMACNLLDYEIDW